MRVSLIASLIISSLLAACASDGNIPPSKHVSQSGALKVDPELVKPPRPAEMPADASKR